MAAHENRAAGLIGGGGALFAAWVAANSIVQQMRLPLLAREEDRIEREGPGARDSIALIWAIDDELRKANGKPGPMLNVVAAFARGTLIETNPLYCREVTSRGGRFSATDRGDVVRP